MKTLTYAGPDRRRTGRTLSQQAQIMMHLVRELAVNRFDAEMLADLVAARWMFARNLIAGKYDPIWESESDMENYS